jgi:hypothetical protein
MEISTAKKLLSNDFLNALKYKIPEDVQNDSDFQVYACDSLNGLMAAAKEIDRLGHVRVDKIDEEDKLASFLRKLRDAANMYLADDYWSHDFERVSRIIDQMPVEIKTYESLPRAIFVMAVDAAKTDSLKLLFKMSATI